MHYNNDYLTNASLYFKGQAVSDKFIFSTVLYSNHCHLSCLMFIGGPNLAELGSLWLHLLFHSILWKCDCLCMLLLFVWINKVTDLILHLFIPDISIALLQVHYYSEALRNAALMPCGSYQ